MFKKCLAVYLALALLFMMSVPRVEASFSPSGTVNLSPAVRAGDIEKIRVVLENKVVSQRLLDLGFSSEEVSVKLAGLSDSQIHELAQKLDSVKVGQDGAVIVIIVLLIVIAGLLFLYVTGKKVILTK